MPKELGSYRCQDRKSLALCEKLARQILSNADERLLSFIKGMNDVPTYEIVEDTWDPLSALETMVLNCTLRIFPLGSFGYPSSPGYREQAGSWLWRELDEEILRCFGVGSLNEIQH